jgi:hypothetical protein
VGCPLLSFDLGALYHLPLWTDAQQQAESMFFTRVRVECSSAHCFMLRHVTVVILRFCSWFFIKAICLKLEPGLLGKS